MARDLRIDPAWAASSYLAFRHVAGPVAWSPGVAPKGAAGGERARFPVRSAEDLVAGLRAVLDEIDLDTNVGLLLSGGIDSAILAALLPRGTRAYTIRFVAAGAVDEAPAARRYAEIHGLRHRIVEVGWKDYVEGLDDLMENKGAPLHPVEIGLRQAARTAAADGVHRLIVGNGADSNFGGLDRLLSRDWSFDEFVKRYTFVDPRAVLAEPADVDTVFAPYRTATGIDVLRFLAEVHGAGILEAFENAIGAGGCVMIAPYEALYLDAPLDLDRIRRGESKYLVRAAFRRLYPRLETAEKIAFARPMDAWMAGWTGPRRPEFLPGIDLAALGGEGRFLVYSLERFLDLLAREAS